MVRSPACYVWLRECKLTCWDVFRKHSMPVITRTLIRIVYLSTSTYWHIDFQLTLLVCGRTSRKKYTCIGSATYRTFLHYLGGQQNPKIKKICIIINIYIYTHMNISKIYICSIIYESYMSLRIYNIWIFMHINIGIIMRTSMHWEWLIFSSHEWLTT